MSASLDFGTLLGNWIPDTPNTLPFWNDPHISSQMLAAHLDPGHDAASRRPELISRTIEWILARPFGEGRKETLDILDLGCGPGLYALPLARAGHRVTGIDISERSLDHARVAAGREGVSVDYRLGNYLELECEARHDLVMLIYCDYGALSRAGQRELLRRAFGALRPGGLLVLDAWDESFVRASPDHRHWTWQDQGFWSPEPHLVLEESRHLPDDLVVLRRIVVLDGAARNARSYFLQDYYYPDGSLETELRNAGFVGVELAADVIRRPDSSAPGVTFAAARKPG